MNVRLFAAGLCLAFSTSAFATGTHPRTIVTATQLSNLHSNITSSPYSTFYSGRSGVNLQNFWTAETSTAVDPGNPNHLTYLQENVAAGPYLHGYAILSQIMPSCTDAWCVQAVDLDQIRHELEKMCHFDASAYGGPGASQYYQYASDCDTDTADELRSAAITYDVMYGSLSTMGAEGTGLISACENEIGYVAQSLILDVGLQGLDTYPDAGYPGMCRQGAYWYNDYTNDHSWVNYSAIGTAAQALNGVTSPLSGWPASSVPSSWLTTAENAAGKIRKAQDFSTDGAWHEGLGYTNYGLFSMMQFWMGQVIVSSSYSTDKSNLVHNYGQFVLYQQQPNHPHVSGYGEADNNWVRPDMLAILRWIGQRWSDTPASYATEAATRFTTNPLDNGSGLGGWFIRSEFAPAFALELIAFSPTAPIANMSTAPKDIYNDNEQSFIMRTDTSYGSSDLGMVVTLKAGGYLGGKGLRNNMTLSPDFDFLNYSHDHIDDMGLWIYGNGGWLLPEQGGYDCCDSPRTTEQDTDAHNSMLFSGGGAIPHPMNVGANGDGKSDRAAGPGTDQNAYDPVHDTPAWYKNRSAAMPLAASTGDYAFAMASTGNYSGVTLYPSNSYLKGWTRTIGLTRDSFIVLRDRIDRTADLTSITQVFHSMSPPSEGATGVDGSNANWIHLDNHISQADVPSDPNLAVTVTPSDTALGIYMVSPQAGSWSAVTSEVDDYANTTHYGEMYSSNGRFGRVRVSQSLSTRQATFLEVMWPTTNANWSSRPTIQPLDTSTPSAGFSVGLGSAGTEEWIFNVNSASSETYGDLTFSGGLGDNNQFGLVRYTVGAPPFGSKSISRSAIVGPGRLKIDPGVRSSWDGTLLDVGTTAITIEATYPRSGVIALSGPASSIVGVKVYAAGTPTSITYNSHTVSYTVSQNVATITSM